MDLKECNVCKVKQPLTYYKPAKTYNSSGVCTIKRGKTCKLCRKPETTVKKRNLKEEVDILIESNKKLQEIIIALSRKVELLELKHQVSS